MANPEAHTAFNGNAEQFADYATSVRGYVRYEVVHRNLEPFIASQPLRVADVGGGAGIDTLWLAEHGHEVTLIEPAQDQLAIAHEAISKAPADVRARITFIKDGIDMLPQLKEQFDLVLCHGVAMYVPNPQSFLTKLSELVKPGGHVSLLEKGYYGKQANLTTSQNWVALAALRPNLRVINNVDRKAASFMPKELGHMLERAGIQPLEWSGVRVVTDAMHQPISEFTPSELQAIIDVEYEQGHHEHLRWGAQMLHFIGQKEPSKKP